MISHEIRQKLQSIIRGESLEGQTDNCTTIRNFLSASFGADPTAKREFESRSILKEEQARFLESLAKETGIWLEALPKGCQYLTRGGEAEVYLSPDFRHVIKLNDAVYYATWTEYFTSLLIHNLLFPDTVYELLGFIEIENKGLCAVLTQPFVVGGQAELDEIHEYLEFIGFKHSKRQDYLLEEFGLLLKDMHDENVIATEEVLFFIDTVFYVMEKK